jgi:hypothetical protein
MRILISAATLAAILAVVVGLFLLLRRLVDRALARRVDVPRYPLGTIADDSPESERSAILRDMERRLNSDRVFGYRPHHADDDPHRE